MCFCGWLLLFKCVGLAHDDGCGRRAEARHRALDPLRCCLAEPAAMLSAVGAVKLAGMRPRAGADDTHVAAARPLAVGGAVELNLEANEAAVGSRPSHDGVEHLDLRSHADLPCAMSAGSGVIMMVSAGTGAYRLIAMRSTTRLSSATTIALIASSAALM